MLYVCLRSELPSRAVLVFRIRLNNNRHLLNMRAEVKNKHGNCLTCGKELVRKEKEKAATFRARQACSTECRKILRSAINLRKAEERHGKGCMNPKPCEVCKNPFERHDDEPYDGFVARKTCGKKCGHLLRISKINAEPVKFKHKLGYYWEQWSDLEKMQHRAVTGEFITLCHKRQSTD